MTEQCADLALTRILEALEREIIAAPDFEITSVLEELGMRPEMKGSVALFELLHRLRPDLVEDPEPDGETILPFWQPREARRPE